MVVLMSIWNGIKSVGKWLWSRPAVLAAIIGAIIGGFFVLRSKKNQIGNLKDAIAASKAKGDVARAEARAEALEAQANEKHEEVAKLKREIVRSKMRATEISLGRNLEGMPDDEIADLFSRSGL